MEIKGSTTKEEIKGQDLKCQYCGKKAKYKLKSGEKEVCVCEDCNNNI